MQYHDCLKALNYSYEQFETRDKIYTNILNTFPKELLVNKLKSNKAQQIIANQLCSSGFANVPGIDKSFVEYINKALFDEQGVNNKNKLVINDEKMVNDKYILQLFCHPRLTRSIQGYLGIFPTIQYITAWESIGGSKINRENEMYWHMDHHGHKFVKVFYYLNDVKCGYGHHEYIKNTHMQNIFDKELKEQVFLSNLRTEIDFKRKLRGKYKIQDDAVLPLSGRIEKVVGNAGIGFGEDTRGLHKGTPLPPGIKRRIIQCLYTPFDNKKDKTSQIKKEDIIKHIQNLYKYSELEVNKLFMCIK